MTVFQITTEKVDYFLLYVHIWWTMKKTLQYNTKGLCTVEHTEYRTPTVSDYMRSDTDIPITFDCYYIFVS